jgi:molecular chaperone GrpE
MPHSIEDDAIAAEAVDPATLVAENAALRDRLLRALAEAENTRSRAAREAEEARKYAIADFARELLIVVDNLDRTVQAAGREAAPRAEWAALIEGVQATRRVMMQTLERFGVRAISALGQRFDPNLHEAIMEAEDPSQPPGTVSRVVEDGYMINDRLLRPARVVVAKGSAASVPTRNGEEPDNKRQHSTAQQRH